MKTKGTGHVPAATNALEDICDGDLQDRVIRKFKDIVKTLKQAKTLMSPASSAHDAVLAPELKNTAPQEDAAAKRLSKSLRQSRQKGVSNR